MAFLESVSLLCKNFAPVFISLRKIASKNVMARPGFHGYRIYGKNRHFCTSIILKCKGLVDDILYENSLMTTEKSSRLLAYFDSFFVARNKS